MGQFDGRSICPVELADQRGGANARPVVDEPLGRVFVWRWGCLNGGCSLSTLQQLADGDSSLLLTLMGFVAGIATTSAMENHWLPQTTHASPLWWVGRTPLQHLLLVSLLSLWAVRVLSLPWRRRDRCQSVWQRMAAPRYRLSFGALLLGVSSGLLFLIEGAWTYTNYLREQTRALFFEGAATAWLPSALVLALLMGMLTSSVHRRSFRWRWPSRNNWHRRSLGGLLMGAGGAMLPGGNDTLILVLIPTLSIQAVASYMALLTGIACVLLMMRRRQ